MNTGGIAGERLRAFVHRIERLHEDRKAIGDDIRDVYAEAKSNGFDPKIMKIVIRDRAMDSDVRQERDALYELYWAAANGTGEDEKSPSTDIRNARTRAGARGENPTPELSSKHATDSGAVASSPEPSPSAETLPPPPAAPVTGEAPAAPVWIPAQYDMPPIPDSLRRTA